MERIRLTINGTTHATDGMYYISHFCMSIHHSTYSVLSSLVPNNITLQVSVVTTSSITVIPSGPPGEVSYEETGSSHGPTDVSYSSSITISNLKPNTWYTITYIVQNSYSTKMTNVSKVTLPEGEHFIFVCISIASS